jgi:hypothetical protein
MEGDAKKQMFDGNNNGSKRDMETIREAASSLTIPVVRTVSYVVHKDVFFSKKYRLAFNLLMWATVCWRSIPDVADVLFRCMQRHKEKRHSFLVRCLLFLWDFGWMGTFFFLRRWTMILIMWRTRRVIRPSTGKYRLTRGVDLSATAVDLE